MTPNNENRLFPINIDGAQISSASVESIKFMQDENYVCSMISNVDEVIDIILEETFPYGKDADTQRLAIVRNLREISRHLSTFKIDIDHER
ncbi:hypothetical protein [uncultured Bacteroides sp.]|jgi:hypothetical protein|uniref:hypothetical protein n=1 Tax=uncultured Bacteroides sp. TaxID=162156 RepID=UPI00206351A0|nr:hypothetical protein [uncultured Bacteroides sp.]DAL36984.1 MAG TPA_asm: hypothetical protein [Caudoviricetes sp.]